LASTKSAHAFRTISEAAEEVGAPQHVLRFWETKFAFVTPVKRAGGRRFYRPADIAVLKAVKRLLHDDGLTIRGVQRLHKAQGLKRLLGAEASMLVHEGESPEPAATPSASAKSPVDAARLRALLADLEQARARLDAVLSH
jgi:DNA-binding transcriptional MerR regulator